MEWGKPARCGVHCTCPAQRTHILRSWPRCRISRNVPLHKCSLAGCTSWYSSASWPWPCWGGCRRVRPAGSPVRRTWWSSQGGVAGGPRGWSPRLWGNDCAAVGCTWPRPGARPFSVRCSWACSGRAVGARDPAGSCSGPCLPGCGRQCGPAGRKWRTGRRGKRGPGCWGKGNGPCSSGTWAGSFDPTGRCPPGRQERCRGPARGSVSSPCWGVPSAGGRSRGSR